MKHVSEFILMYNLILLVTLDNTSGDVDYIGPH
jgi:hypothetical protein